MKNRLTYKNLKKLSSRRSITNVVEPFKICKGISICNRLVND